MEPKDIDCPNPMGGFHVLQGVEEVNQRAVETGVETLYRDMIISQYLDGDLSREEAVEELGADVVDDVDASRDAIEEDVEWGLHA